jgi:thiamine monophosphate kinase
MDQEDKLSIELVDIAWSTDEHVYVRNGMEAGDRIVTSDLGAPVEGMKLRLPGRDGREGPGEDEQAGGQAANEGEPR